VRRSQFRCPPPLNYLPSQRFFPKTRVQFAFFFSSSFLFCYKLDNILTIRCPSPVPVFSIFSPEGVTFPLLYVILFSHDTKRPLYPTSKPPMFPPPGTPESGGSSPRRCLNFSGPSRVCGPYSPFLPSCPTPFHRFLSYVHW